MPPSIPLTSLSSTRASISLINFSIDAQVQLFFFFLFFHLINNINLHDIDPFYSPTPPPPPFKFRLSSSILQKLLIRRFYLVRSLIFPQNHAHSRLLSRKHVKSLDAGRSKGTCANSSIVLHETWHMIQGMSFQLRPRLLFPWILIFVFPIIWSSLNCHHHHYLRILHIHDCRLRRSNARKFSRRLRLHLFCILYLLRKVSLSTCRTHCCIARRFFLIPSPPTSSFSHSQAIFGASSSSALPWELLSSLFPRSLWVST